MACLGMIDMTGELRNNADIVVAPWNEDQIRSLNEYQTAGVFHRYTGTCDDDLLIATPFGWQSDTGWRQEWAWRWTADWSWKKLGMLKGDTTE